MLGLQNIIIPNEGFEAYYNALDYYIVQRRSSDNLSEIINHGLSVFLQLPNSKSATLFLLNDNTFEFEFRATLPISEKDELEQYFNCLIEERVIGEALETSEIIQGSSPNVDLPQSYILIPLVVSGSIYGIILTLHERPIEEKLLLSMVSIHAGLFASSLDNISLANELKKTKTTLEQKVAARTMSLTQSKRELQAILDSVQAGILIIDPVNNTIVNVNPIASYIIGESTEKIVGKNISLFFPNYNFDEHQHDEKLKFSRNFESTITSINGTLVPILRTCSNIIISEQKFRIESFFDITQRKKAELELKQTNEMLEQKVQERTLDLQVLVTKLQEEVIERQKVENEIRRMLEKEQELNELKTRFISMVSHEFRTPLTIISSSSQFIESYREQLSSFELDDLIRTIIKSVNQMKDLLENILLIGKADSQLLEYNPHKVNVPELCKSILSEINLTLSNSRDIRLTIDCETEFAFSDEKLLRHILFNLLSNALKYSKNDKPVDFSISCREYFFQFIVKDYGIGIPKEEQVKIFDVFHRAKNVGAISGTGLGMSIVMRCLELLNGTIKVDSKLNIGSTFTVNVPIQKDHYDEYYN